MENRSEHEIALLNQQIGSLLRLARLKTGLSQLELAVILGTNPTMIGRIERAENFCSWEKIFLISTELKVEFSTLFEMLTEDKFIKIVEESLNLEQKLTLEKAKYYSALKSEISRLFSLVKK